MLSDKALGGEKHCVWGEAPTTVGKALSKTSCGGWAAGPRALREIRLAQRPGGGNEGRSWEVPHQLELLLI